MKLNITIFALLSGLLTACAANESNLRDTTSGVLGYTPSEVTITGLRSDATHTYYVAKTPKGEYACTSESGVTQALQYGLTNPPKCNKKD